MLRVQLECRDTLRPTLYNVVSTGSKSSNQPQVFLSMVLVSVQVSRVISYLPHGSRRQEGHQDLANDLSSDAGYRVQSSLSCAQEKQRLGFGPLVERDDCSISSYAVELLLICRYTYLNPKPESL